MRHQRTIIPVLFLVLTGYLPVEGQAGIITTIAGTGVRGYSGDGNPAVWATLNKPAWLVAGPNGEFYFSEWDNHCVRRVGSDGMILTMAGTGVRGYSGDGSSAFQAQLNNPAGVAVDAVGNLYIADGGNHRVRRVGSDGIITTFAGTGVEGFSGDGGAATQAQLNNPAGVAVDAVGNLYIADGGNHRVRRVGSDGIITTVVGTGISGYAGDGRLATQAQLNGPSDLALDGAGNLYIADEGNHRIRRVGVDGIITTFAGTGESGFSGDGSPALQARLNHPFGVAIDAAGDVYIADRYNHRLRRVGPDGIITTWAGTGTNAYAGDGGPATEAKLNVPTDVAVDAQGHVYLTDHENHRIRRVQGETGTTPSLPFGAVPVSVPLPVGGAVGEITTIAGTGVRGYSGDGNPAVWATLNKPAWLVAGPNGEFYFSEWDNHCVRRVGSDGMILTMAGTGVRGYSGDDGPAFQAQLNNPAGIAMDAAGNLYIADHANHRVRRVGVDGIITTFAGTGESGFSGDGGAATQAKLKGPNGMVIDTAGNLYIADAGNHRVRRVGVDGIITTVVGTGISGYAGDGRLATQAQVNGPSDLALDAAGNLYIADAGNHRVRRVGVDGIITTLAGTGESGFSGDGSPALQARLNHPFGVAVDAAGNVYIAERWNHRIRRVGVDGIITTLAGTGVNGYGGDEGPATEARLNDPVDVAVDAQGHVYLTDHENHRIRRVQGEGLSAPLIALSTSFLSFGTVRVGSSAVQTFTVSNTGTSSLTVSNIAVSGPEAIQFTLSPMQFTVAPGATAQTVTVTFTPSSAGTKSAALTLTHNAVGSPSSVALTGTGISPPTVALSLTALTFEEVQVGQSKPLTLTVSNTGGSSLSITGIAVSGTDAAQFTVSPATAEVAAGQSQTATVTFSPSSAGVKSATLTLTHNAGSPSSLPLTGTGALPQAINLSSSALAFGEVQVGQNKSMTVTISNTGGSPLSITGITVGGTDAAQFTVIPATAEVAAGQSRTVTVIFLPTSAGAKSASLAIAHNASESPTTVAVSGTGTTSLVPDLQIAGKIAFHTNRDGSHQYDYELYTMNPDGTNPLRLTNNAIFDGWPTWSPDGTQIAFESSSGGNSDGNAESMMTNNEIYVMNIDGTNITRLTNWTV